MIATARVASAVLGAATPIVVVRALDQATFGGYKQFFLVATALLAILSVALPQSLFYFVPNDPDRSQRYMEQTATALAATGLLGALVVLTGGSVLSAWLKVDVHALAGWLAAYMIVLVPGSLAPMLAMVDRQAKLSAIIVTVTEISRSVLIVLAALLVGTVDSIAAVACVVALGQCVVVVVYLTLRRRRFGLSPREGVIRRQLAYSTPLAATTLVGMARDQLHAFYITVRRTTADFALYAVGTLNVPLINQVTQTLGEVLVLEASRHWAAQDREALRRVWYRVCHIMFLFVLPLFVLLELHAADLLGVVYGPTYRPAAVIFRVNLVLLPLSVGLLASPLLRATGDASEMLVADISSLIATAVTVGPLVSWFGMAGAVLCLLVGNVVFIAVAAARVRARLDVRWWRVFPWLDGVKIGATALVSAGSWWLALGGVRPLVRLALGLPLGFLTFGVLAWRFGLVPEGEMRLVERLLERVPVARRVWGVLGGA